MKCWQFLVIEIELWRSMIWKSLMQDGMIIWIDRVLFANTTNMMIKNFFKCGIAGWCMEVVWTSIMGIKNHDRNMIGKTSIWMFPIYGLGTVIKPLSSKLRKFNMIFRGFIYMAGIYFVEFISGTILQRNNCCPWNYNKCK